MKNQIIESYNIGIGTIKHTQRHILSKKYTTYNVQTSYTRNLYRNYFNT